MKKILFVIITLLIFPVVGNAVCTSAEKSEIMSLASNVNISYEIKINNNKPMYHIYLNNLTSDMLLFDTKTGKMYNKFSDKGDEFSIVTSLSGSYAFDIYSYKCKESIMTKMITLPKYNIFYLDPLCEGLSNYSICQRWSTFSGSYDDFKKQVNKIKKEEETKKELKEEKKPEPSIYDKIASIFLKYWWIIVIVLVGILGIYYFIRTKQKKNEYDFNL